ncbi:MAG: host attachment protein [Paracoccaceae bacterium]|nr:host attachment protein [Paracoccaceae bacterium]
MKPKSTWIVLANARIARIVEHQGAGNGLFTEPGMVLHAEEPTEYSDRAGTGHSIAGHGTSAVDMGNPKDQAAEAFAHNIVERLSKAVADGDFDRVVIIASPHMLGLLRKSMSPEVADKIMAELDKDLTAIPVTELEKHLGSVLLV